MAARIVDSFIDSAHGMVCFVVQDDHGTVSRHSMYLDNKACPHCGRDYPATSGIPDPAVLIEQVLTERDTRTATIDAHAAKHNMRVNAPNRPKSTPQPQG